MNDESKILANRYEIGDLIGRGGMAEVHIGYDTRLGRTVAIKILRPDLARDPSFQTRFRREAQAAAGLNHPSIVAVYDTGEDNIVSESGNTQTVPFIVMEYVEGHTVRDILKGDVAAPIDEAVEITAGVLAALDYAHHAGLVHRDIKPANVMLTPTGAVKVMDFGIARALADAGQTMTQTQAVVGTAQYLSPEQARGENVDARSDLYSAGCLLFELLTGRPPFIGDSPVSVAYQHVREEAPLASTFASDVPLELDRVVAKSLKKSRDDRYSTAQEFLADMRGAIGEPVAGATDAAAFAAVAAGADESGNGGAVAGAAAAGVLAGAAIAGAGDGSVPGAGTGETAVMPASAAGWATVVGGPPPTEAYGAMPAAVAVQTAPGDPDLVYDNPRRRRTIQIAILLGAIVAAGLLIWLLFALTKGPADEPTEGLVTIPIVENQSEDDAVAMLEDLDLEVEVESQASADVEKDRAIGTDPEAGEEVEVGSTVTLFISAGPDEIEIPSVRGLLQADAVEKLESAGLVVAQIESSHDPDIDNGRATGTNPEEATIASPDDPITLYVSDGQVELPDVRKLQENQARATLVSLGLLANVVYVETEDFTAGEVISQDPLPGLVQQRSTITLQVAKAPTTVAVPNVTGKTEAEARQNLQDAGLAASTTSQSSETVPTGKVISQNPSAGITVAKGTTVALVISTGPAVPAT